MIFAPLSTAQTIAAASCTSVKEPSAAPAWTTRRRASPPVPAIPSPFVAEPAASEATNVPWPFPSTTSPLPVRTFHVAGVFTARSGAERSAPVSTTAIVRAAAARWICSGTRFAFTAAYCHW